MLVTAVKGVTRNLTIHVQAPSLPSRQRGKVLLGPSFTFYELGILRMLFLSDFWEN
jgi:hypothetical protein